MSPWAAAFTDLQNSSTINNKIDKPQKVFLKRKKLSSAFDENNFLLRKNRQEIERHYIILYEFVRTINWNSCQDNPDKRSAWRYKTLPLVRLNGHGWLNYCGLRQRGGIGWDTCRTSTTRTDIHQREKQPGGKGRTSPWSLLLNGGNWKTEQTIGITLLTESRIT